MNLNEKLFELRKKNGWSQEELAEKLDVSRQTVSKWESNNAVPELEKLIKLSEIYNPTDNEVEFDLYLKVFREINNFFYCVQDGKIEIISKMDKEEKGVKTYILLKGKCNDKEYDLLKINVLEYEYSIGDRKNRFDLKGFEAHIDMGASIIYEYLFEDDCSPYYNKKNTSNIIYKAM